MADTIWSPVLRNIYLLYKQKHTKPSRWWYRITHALIAARIQFVRLLRTYARNECKCLKTLTLCQCMYIYVCLWRSQKWSWILCCHMVEFMYSFMSAVHAHIVYVEIMFLFLHIHNTRATCYIYDLKIYVKERIRFELFRSMYLRRVGMRTWRRTKCLQIYTYTLQGGPNC